MKQALLTLLALGGSLVTTSAQTILPQPTLANRSGQMTGVRLVREVSESFRGGAWRDSIRITNSNFTAADLPRRVLTERVLNGAPLASARRDHIIYNAANKVANDTTFTFSTTGVATARFTSTYAYTAGGQLRQQTSRTLLGTSWQNSGRITFTYDAQSHLTLELSEVSLGNTYYPSSQILYTNNAQGLPTVSELQQSDGSGGWLLGTKELFTYTASGMVSTYVQQRVPVGGSTYQNFLRETYTYNPAAPTQVTRVVSEVWSNNAWAEAGQYLYVYDNTGNLTSMTAQQRLSPNNYRNNSRTLYTYQVVTANNPARTLNANLAVWPNPASGAATAQYRLPAAAAVSVEVFDGLGRRVAAPLAQQPQAAGEQRVALPATLAAGLYTVRVSTADGRSQQSKLVVQ